jgi:hypothetical protein
VLIFGGNNIITVFNRQPTRARLFWSLAPQEIRCAAGIFLLRQNVSLPGLHSRRAGASRRFDAINYCRTENPSKHPRLVVSPEHLHMVLLISLWSFTFN